MLSSLHWAVCSLSALRTVVPFDINETERLELSSVWFTVWIKGEAYISPTAGFSDYPLIRLEGMVMVRVNQSNKWEVGLMDSKI